MVDQSSTLMLVGVYFLIVLIIHPLALRFNIPRASLYILSGLLLDLLVGDYIRSDIHQWFGDISAVTLLIVGYLLGTKLDGHYLRKYIVSVTLSTVCVTLGTFGVVSLGLWVLSFPLPLCLILGVLAVATDPAATFDVLNQKKQRNGFSNMLQGIVALDDAAGLVLFSLVVAVLAWAKSESSHFPILIVVWELGGAVALGGLLGFLLVYLLARRHPRDNVFIESLGLLLLCGGLAIYLEVAFLIAAIVMGVIVVNRGIDTQTHLHDIEFFEQPLLILFFILAGASASIEGLLSAGTVLLAYVVLRVTGRLLSAAWLPKTALPLRLRLWLGAALLPQAGVAVGLALLAAQYYPDYQNTLITVTVSATVIFELIGPFFTALALQKANREPTD